MSGIDRLLEVMATLRSPSGCPWDREQTLSSLRRYAVEEVYEVLDAIDREDVEDHCEELGDLLLQVVFQSQLRTEEGAFTFDDVVSSITEKLIRRHPHVFGDHQADTPEEVMVHWNRIKQEEKGDAEPQSALASIPHHLPALLKAQETQKKAAKLGFDWPDLTPVLAKIQEEVEEVTAELDPLNREAALREASDLLFSVVNLIRHLGGDAEQGLQDTTRSFRQRFGHVESRVNASGRPWPDWTLTELDQLWDEAKRIDKSDS